MQTSPGKESAVLVLMMPDHYAAYCNWLAEAKLMASRLDSITTEDLLVFIVTPAGNHPAGKRP